MAEIADKEKPRTPQFFKWRLEPPPEVVDVPDNIGSFQVKDKRADADRTDFDRVEVEAKGGWWIVHAIRRTIDGGVLEVVFKAPQADYWAKKRWQVWKKKYKGIVRSKSLEFYDFLRVRLTTWGIYIVIFLAFLLATDWLAPVFLQGAEVPFVDERLRWDLYVFGYRLFYIDGIAHLLLVAVGALVGIGVAKVFANFIESLISMTGQSQLMDMVVRLYRRNQPLTLPYKHPITGELNHVLVVGATGSGKTSPTIKPMIVDRAAQRGTVFVFDPKADTKGLYVLFDNVYPFDLSAPRGFSIDPFDFLPKHPSDKDYILLAQYLVPRDGIKEPYWPDEAAKRIVAPVLKYTHEVLKLPFSYSGFVYQNIVDYQLEDIATRIFADKKLVAHILGGRFASSQTYTSYIAIAAGGFSALTDGNMISLFSDSLLTWRELTAPSTIVPIIWDPNDQGSPTFRTAVSIFFWVLNRAAILLREHHGEPDHPITFIVDEILNLPPQDIMYDIAQLYRGYGVQLVMATQSISGLAREEKYKREGAMALVENMQTMVVPAQGTTDEYVGKRVVALIPELRESTASYGYMQHVSKAMARQWSETAGIRLINALRRDFRAKPPRVELLLTEPHEDHKAVHVLNGYFLPREVEKASAKAYDITLPMPDRSPVSEGEREMIATEVLMRMLSS